MKALVRFYGKSGRWYDVGDIIHKEDEKTTPKNFISKDEVVKPKSDKVSSKVSTKNGRPKKIEDKYWLTPTPYRYQAQRTI